MAALLCNFNTASSWLINGALDSSMVAAVDVKEPADVGLGSPWMATSFDRAVVENHLLVLMKSSSRGDLDTASPKMEFKSVNGDLKLLTKVSTVPHGTLSDSRPGSPSLRRSLAPPSGLRIRGGIGDEWEDWLHTYADPYACKDKSEFRFRRYLMKKVNQVKAVDGELRARLGCRRSSRISPSIPAPCLDLEASRAHGSPMADEKDDSMEVPADDPGRCVVSDPLCDVDLDVGLPLSPILEETSLVGGKLQCIAKSIEEMSGVTECARQSSEMRVAGAMVQKSDGDDQFVIEIGQASYVLPELQCKDASDPSSVLPEECSIVGMDELGEASAVSVQGSLIQHVQEVVPVVMSTEDQCGLSAQVQPSQGLDGDFILAGKSLGIQRDGAHDGPAVTLAQGASVGSGDRGGSGHSYASAVGSGRRSDVRLHFVPTVKLDEGDEL
ncbi:hypothetical protein Dimus_020369, partial [Dionaea muscipula]